MERALLARTVRGVEDVAAAEIEGRLWPRSLEIAHRSVRFRARLDRSLLELGTVDDVFVVAATAADPGRTRAALAAAARLGAVDGGALLAAVRTVREVRAPLGFDVVASALGNRTFNRFQLADAVGAAIGAASGWTYRSRTGGVRADAPLSFRLHLDGETAVLALRLAARPLHRRPYRGVTRPGSLHPPLARVLAHLCGVGPGLVLLDPCCGAGTIPIEALLAEPRLRAVARDVDAAAVAAAARNARRAGVRLDLAPGDAARVRLPDGSVDRIACNPPWGRLSPPRGRLKADPCAAWREAARLLAADGRLAVLAPRAAAVPRALAAAGLEVCEVRFVRVAGAEAEIVLAER